MEPISEINKNYEEMKENMSMMNFERERENDGAKGLQRKVQGSEKSSGKQYPFYQMTMN
jgi:hypothetical protein